MISGIFHNLKLLLCDNCNRVHNGLLPDWFDQTNYNSCRAKLQVVNRTIYFLTTALKIEKKQNRAETGKSFKWKFVNTSDPTTQTCVAEYDTVAHRDKILSRLSSANFTNLLCYSHHLPRSLYSDCRASFMMTVSPGSGGSEQSVSSSLTECRVHR